MLDQVNTQALKDRCVGFKDAKPFSYAVIDDFLSPQLADALEAEIPAFDSDVWHEYLNAIEIKRTCNNWNRFPPATYSFFNFLNAPAFIELLSKTLGIAPLYPDPGLNGGGWHIHRAGGKLNTHLDYSIHPKVGLQRKLNLILYMNRDWQAEWGGSLGLWEHNLDTGGPGKLVSEVEPVFNRAVLFDTTQNSWHGLPSPITCPADRERKSLAVYYLTDPPPQVDTRGKALFAPTDEQKYDADVLELIRRRSQVQTAESVYKS